MQQQQQQMSVISPGANPGQPGTVVFVTQSPAANYPMHPERPKELPLKSFHFAFGIIQMVIGVLMFIVEVSALATHVPFATGPGIYCGIFIFVAGLLSMLGAKLNSRCLLIACLVMDIIATVVCAIGIGLASTETAILHYYLHPVRYAKTGYPYYRFAISLVKFGLGKSIFVLIFCVLEFIALIIHASLSCRSVCDCCLPRKMEDSNSNNGVTAHGQSTQQGFAYVNQAAYPQQQGATFVPQGAVVVPQGAMVVPQGAMVAPQGVAFMPQGVASSAPLQQQPCAYYMPQQPQMLPQAQMQPPQPPQPEQKPQDATGSELRQNPQPPSYDDDMSHLVRM